MLLRLGQGYDNNKYQNLQNSCLYTDPDISAISLNPEEDMSVRLEFRFLDNKKTQNLEKIIKDYHSCPKQKLLIA